MKGPRSSALTVVLRSVPGTPYFVHMQRLRDQLLITCAVVALLYVGRAVFVPLAFALLIAMILYPSVARMERAGLARGLAIGVGLSAVVVLFLGLGGLLLLQLDAFLDSAPGLLANIERALTDLRNWSQGRLGLDPGLPTGKSEDLLARLPNDAGRMAVAGLSAVFGAFFQLLLIPVLAAVLLADRQALVRTAAALAPATVREHLPSILQRSVHRFARFIYGMLQVYLIVGVLNSIGLLLLGVPNAILFGMLTAIMTIIPYVGIVLSALLPIAVTWAATGTIWAPLGVVAVFAVVQYLEANIIFPRVVGAKLGLNTFASIVLVLVGALLWGVAGMVLLLPYMSIAVLLSAEVPGWEALGLLLGPTGKRGK